ncbi:Dyp-type peroxidase [Pseudonocardia endophytica]|uniref:Putative iron-dependent peroxidase n=1 Tax=Pseudonocardia endophytica TaxID=401976 RepID=A0A4R1HIW2_PSEEN|nr:Dyp-type peroxidase [Pseudonocardia endophytica]TCK21768.1 putative iron-dependent peroxidase [Pseudonocardia endophytica]
MPTPQDVLAPLTDSALFLTLTVHPGHESTVHDFLPDLGDLVKSVGFPHPGEDLHCVLGISSDAWDRLLSGPRPRSLHPFREIAGDRHRAPATAGDLFLHLRSTNPYPCFELARRVVTTLGDAVEVADEVVGFRYFDRRDLLGFVDGTANPTGGDAASAALIGDEDPAFSGGSYLIVQKYLHDLDAWTAKPVEERECSVGRRMLENLEIPDDEKAPDSHVTLTTITDPDGTERDIVRDNMPFGSLARGEYGTYFAGYAADPSVTERMLTRMFVGEPPGTTDRLLEVSTAVTGGLFFVPSADLLDDPPPLPTATDEPTGDGTLGIGGLKDR